MSVKQVIPATRNDNYCAQRHHLTNLRSKELARAKFGTSILGPYRPPDPTNPGTTTPTTPAPDPELPPETRLGALTNLQIGTNLDCRVDSPADNRSVFYDFYGSNECGTHLAVDGQTFDYVGNGFTPTSAQSRTGAGTAASPEVLTTTVAAGASGLGLKQVDTAEIRTSGS